MSQHPPPPPAEAEGDTSPRALAGRPVHELLERATRTGVGRALGRRFLAALRGSEDPDAQVGAVLLLFHLARRGDSVAQIEFMLLRPSLEETIPYKPPDFLGRDVELNRLWDDVQEAMTRADPRDRVPVFPFKVGPSPEVALFEGLPELRSLVTSTLGQDLRQQAVRLGAMLDLESAEDIERLESFLRSVGAWAALEPEARGLACLGHLYLAVHLRRHTMFSTLNERRSDALRIGLSALGASLDSLQIAAAFLAAEGDHVEGHQKVLELIIDYLGWCHRQGLDPLAPEAIEAYAGEGRLPEMVLAGGRRRRR
ncbi:MAG: hypothetical protein P1V51_13775 [Deltaproteobacteria bacterium]|nr:hypothetical protein [Deltaproteobacteria bacterium]